MEFKYIMFVNLTVNIILVTRLRASRFLKKIKIQLKGLSFFLIVALAVSLFFNMNIYPCIQKIVRIRKILFELIIWGQNRILK